MRPRFPESSDERAARLLGTARLLAGPRVGALESAGVNLPPAAAIAARLERNLAALGVATAVAKPQARLAAREGIGLISDAGRGNLDIADLEPTKLSALEAVIRVVGRPSWLVRGDMPALGPADDSWAMDVQDRFLCIPQASRSIGAIFKTDGEKTAVGTGWMIAPRLLATNAHVARHLFFRKMPVAAGDVFNGWRPRPGVTGEIDFSLENGGDTPRRFAIAGMRFIETSGDPDLAILAVAPKTGEEPPEKLDLTLDPDRIGGWPGAHVFVLGHPLGDLQDDPNVPLVFPTIDGTKRFSPGEALGLLGGAGEVLAHDCSTINGSSGSPVIDFLSMKVAGLHYFGKPGDRNEAVFMPAIKDHPAIRKALNGGFDV